MPTGKQVRAARVLVGWEAQDLADKTGLNRETIFKIERGTANPKPETMAKIVKVFDDHRVEFLDDLGVRIKPDGIQVLQGREGLIALLEDVYDMCRRGQAGEVVMSGISEDSFQENLGSFDDSYIDRMSALDNVNMRCLIEEGDHNFVSSSYAQYKWAPKNQFKAVPFYCYADKLAIILFSPAAQLKIYVIKAEEVAQAYRYQFESMWNEAKVIPEEVSK